MDSEPTFMDLVTTIAILFYGMVGELLKWLDTNLFAFELLTVALIVAAVVHYGQRFKTNLHRSRVKERGNKMFGDERRQYCQAIISDMITEGFLDLEIKGKITRQEAYRYYRMFGKVFKDLPDLHPVSNHPAAINKRVRENIAKMKETPKPNLPVVEQGFPLSVVETKKEIGFRFLDRKAA